MRISANNSGSNDDAREISDYRARLYEQNALLQENNIGQLISRRRLSVYVYIFDQWIALINQIYVYN